MLDRVLIALSGLARPGAPAGTERRLYELAVERYFGSGNALAFWKGRIALYAILKALGIGPGDEVIVPGYTCVMVPGPVIYLGARPVYVDIEPEHYAVSPPVIDQHITARTKAILVQHTYGMPAPVREIRRRADAQRIAVIEDCCHTFGGRLAGQLLGTFGHAAFFSGQWNKPFSTGLGGLALIHDPELAQRARAIQAALPAPTWTAAGMLAGQLLAYELLIFPTTTALATRAFRWLSRRGLVVGSSSSAEFEPVMPVGYARSAARVQCRLGQREVLRVGANLRARRHVEERYCAELARLGYRVPTLPPDWDTPLLRFPLRVANKAEALAQAARHGVEIGSWFECPLHPHETDQAAFGYVAGMCPISERACAEVINLPTHRRVRPSDVDRTLEFVQSICRPAAPA